MNRPTRQSITICILRLVTLCGRRAASNVGIVAPLLSHLLLPGTYSLSPMWETLAALSIGKETRHQLLRESKEVSSTLVRHQTGPQNA